VAGLGEHDCAGYLDLGHRQLPPVVGALAAAYPDRYRPDLVGAAYRVAGHQVADPTAYRVSFLVAAAVCFAGVASALSIRHADAAATSPPGTGGRSAMMPSWHQPRPATPRPELRNRPAG
jgi:hypothetical protein